IWIACERTPRQWSDVDARNRRVHCETVTGLRHRETECVRATGYRLDGAAVCANSEVGAGQLHRRREMRPGDFSAAPAAPEINPAIRTPLRGVDAAREFARGKAGEEHIARLGFPVTIAVGEEHDIRRARHD